MPQVSVGVVTHDERNAILRIHERRTALDELLLTLDSPYLSSAERDALRTDIESDRVRTDALFEGWWRDIARDHHLESTEHGRWAIDFESRELSFEPAGVQSCQSCCSDCPTDVQA